MTPCCNHSLTSRSKLKTRYLIAFVGVFLYTFLILLGQMLSSNEVKSTLELTSLVDVSERSNMARNRIRQLRYNPSDCQHNDKRSYLTSVKHSKISVTELERMFYVGDIIEVELTAFDCMGRIRKDGGDFWFANLHNKYSTYSTAGHVVDHRNGTYTIYFYAGFADRLYINITLVHPRETLDWLMKEYVPLNEAISWDGFFTTPTNESVCKVQCVTDVTGKCVYGHGRTGLGRYGLVCDQPQWGAGCEMMTSLMAHGEEKGLNHPAGSALWGKEYLFQRPFYMEQISNSESDQFVVVEETFIANENVAKSLPPCKIIGQPDKSAHSRKISDGYWLNETWYSLVCSNFRPWFANDISQCLSNRHVVILGDSTLLQWVTALDEIMTGGSLDMEADNPFYQRRNYSTFDLTFHRHRLAVALHSHYPFKGKMQVFEPEIIDNLSRLYGECKYVIILGFLAHFGTWTFDAYEERLSIIKESLVSLKEDCGSDVIIVVKKGHPRNHPYFASRIHSNNYVFQAMNEIIENVFSDIGVIFVDVWDISLSYPSPNNVHMPMPCIRAELDLLFSQICEMSDSN